MKKWLLIIAALLVAAIIILPWYTNKDLLPFDDKARALAPYQMIELEDGFVHYRRMGPKDGQTVILVHGLSTPLFSWNGIINGLADAGMDVIAYDLYGRGWSDRPDIDNTSEFFNKQLEQLITALEIKEPVDMLGISLGSVITGYYAQSNPEKIRKIALISPGGYVANFSFMLELMRTQVVGGWIMDVFGRNSLIKGVSNYQFPNSPIPDLIERYEEMTNYQGFIESISSTFINFDLVEATRSYKTIGKTNTPVLAIWGTADTTTPYESSALMQSDIPQLELYTIKGATHGLPLSHAPEVTKVLIDYLKK